MGNPPSTNFSCMGLLRKTRAKIGLSPSWLLEEATFEKMGEMMSEIHSMLLGLYYDELSSSLTQIRLVDYPTHMT